jgi:transposase-like protein
MMLRRTERYRLCAARGMSINEVARLYQVTPHAIRLANRTHNLGFSTKRSPRDRDLIAMRERCQGLVAQGKGAAEIAEILEVPVDTVRRWRRTWGLVHRPVLDVIGDLLTPAERDDLLLLKRKGFNYRDAFVAMRRPDLLEYLP